MTTWRSHWRRRINEILDRLPADATRKEAEAALKGQGPPQEPSWPYKSWLNARRDALNARWAKVKIVKRIPTIRFVCESLEGAPKLWLDVVCDWCNRRGCLMCGQHRYRAGDIVAMPEFQSLRAAAIQDSSLIPILGDWLEDNLGDRCSL